MPGMDGYTVCREMRADPILADVPILFLTAKIKSEDKIAGFKAGADDYLCKPFNIDELILRLQAILRRARMDTSKHGGAKQIVERSESASPSSQKVGIEEGTNRIVVGKYALDTRSYEVHTPTQGKVRLTPVQFELLHHLMLHAGEIFSPSRLLDEVWDYPSNTGSPDLVRVHIKNLRERVEENPRAPKFICTVPGYGYTISLDTEG